MYSLLRSVALLFALFTAITFAVHPVEVRGQNFVDTVTNKRLMIIGVDYQPGGQAGYKPDSREDPLSNGTICLRDAALLQRLGVNTIRVYNVDPTINHDECASIFNGVGIYMIIDVNSPLGGESINRADPAGSYHVGYLSRIFGVVENFKGYPNTLGFFAANEVINDMATVKDNPQYIRAVQRDLKNYIAKHADRNIPVGYSAADVRDVLKDTWAYLECAIDGDDDDQSRADFFGLNSYSWCGADATFQTAGYDVLVDTFKDSTIPVFFSEYGCNKPEGVPRPFNEALSLYGEDMTALSGGLVYEYSQEESDYGLVLINENATVTLRKDYDNLESQYNKLDLNLLQEADPTATSRNPSECSEDLLSDAFDKNFTIPSPPDGAEDLINNGIDNPVQGKLVEVRETNVPMAAYGSTGVQIQNLAINLLSNDGTNTPGGDATSPSGTTAAPSPSSTNGGAPSRLKGRCSILIAVFAMVLILL
ncbi:hypothetical protein CC78DRAFT_532141 [Lojkania enalia]|uniref:1,3-beta-glucanosyltransferase n=1 Tax=Lojkania enalia TaxID=147567 RepID=A0A9P4KG13_9PLEO|nr:hypothetical protein CC78DRAFT_532141 [Didymosphaeria enalia]